MTYAIHHLHHVRYHDTGRYFIGVILCAALIAGMLAIHKDR